MTKPRELSYVCTIHQFLATLLLNLATEYGREQEAGIRSLGLTITHDDLARLVGSSREMVSKVMGSFRELGWIRSSRKTIEILDIASLEEVANTVGI